MPEQAGNGEHRDGGVITLVGSLVRRWRDRLARERELENLGPAERARVAADLSLTDHMLTALARQGPQSTELLDRRIAALGLTQPEVEALGRGVWRDLQRTCGSCGEKARCADDFAGRPASDAWRGYCPNADTLGSLAPVRAQPEALPEDARLMYRRLDALGISASEIDRVCSLLEADMAALCGACAEKARCKADLDARPDDPAWREYCANAGTLEGIQGLKGRGRI